MENAMHELDRKQYEYDFDLGASLNRFNNNADFKKVIKHLTDAKQEQLVNSLAPIVKAGESTNIVHRELEAISFLKMMLNKIATDAEYASTQLTED